MRREHIGVVVLAVFMTLLVLSPVAYMAYRAIPPRVATVDLQRLIEDEQKRTIDVLGKTGGVVSDDQRAALQRLSEDFARKLSAAVDQLGAECRCVLVNKAALLGGTSIDYTEIVRDRVKR